MSVIEAFIFTVWIHLYKLFLKNLSFVPLATLKESRIRKDLKNNRFKGSGILKCLSSRIRPGEDRNSLLISLFHLSIRITIGYLVFWKSNRKKLPDNYLAKKLMMIRWIYKVRKIWWLPEKRKPLRLSKKQLQ